ncbi:DUF5129 domain-containing protein [Corynebacterium pacaense]|uniref:DUF5129 domain-containing protein n=1 Tax=Corynebacterium pacaense TaxID=1816684 RepID=UPI0009BC64BA|nr:DUF5129 domain-containing protein [Corynebacterium pacaense]
MSTKTTEATLPVKRALFGITAAAGLLLISMPLAAAQSTTTTLDVSVLDGADQITPEDEDFLRAETPKIGFPEEVRAVRYITFAENSSNLNDDVENLLRTEHPEWIQSDSFAPGELIIVVGFDPHEVGTYAGNDVDSAIGLSEQGRLGGVNDSMKPLLQDGRTASAMYKGAESAADPSVVEETGGGINGRVVAGIAGGGLVAVGGAVAAAVVVSRGKKAKKLRTDFDYASNHYGEVAQQLDGINVRAHSLTSPLADDELRRQWEDVNSRFLELNDTFGTMEALNASSADKEFLAHADAIEKAHTTVTQMETARENIDTLYNMEHGDEGVRRRELTELREDVQEARHEIDEKDSVLDGTLAELISRLEAMDPASQSFMDEYARVIRDYAAALRGVESHLEKVEHSTDRSTPTIYDADWRVGTGYNAFVPYYMISTWHAADVQSAAASAGTSSTQNTTFSSGFSGAGGSSSW